MNLDRSEMAIRKEYKQLVKIQELKRVFRPGNRIYPNWRGYKEGENINIRIIAKPGSDKLNIPPKFEKEKYPIVIKKIVFKCLNELNKDDFRLAPENINTREDLINHFKEIYGYEKTEIEKMCLSIIDFEYT